MASKRILKKEFGELAWTVYEEALFSQWISEDPTRKARLDALMDDIKVWTDDTFRRILHTDATKNRKLVKQYYRNLRKEIEEKANDFLSKIFE